MAGDLLSSTEVAALLGVSPSTVKRWADDGLLRCIKTHGSHRRFARTVVEEFRTGRPARASQPASADPIASWIETLLGPSAPQAVEARLLAMRAEHGSWWHTADALGPVLTRIGDEWAAGRLSVLEEHLATERLARALQRASEWLTAGPGAPRALLATAEGDDHTLGLSLAELCLRELGWSVLWVGRRTPMFELRVALLASPPGAFRLLALSASLASSDRAALTAQLEPILEPCRRSGTELVLGGSGAWPERPSYGTRVHSCAELHQHLAKLGAG